VVESNVCCQFDYPMVEEWTANLDAVRHARPIYLREDAVRHVHALIEMKCAAPVWGAF
jgi:hypothetical protein